MNDSSIKDCLSLFRQLDGRPFSYLKGLTEGDFSVDSNETENDTLNIGAYAIQQSTEQVPTVAGPRPTPVFIVYETVTSPGSYWEPEDADISEFTQVRSFSDAVTEIVMREVYHHVSNIQQSDALATAYSEE
jgi:hypothetical protein